VSAELARVGGPLGAVGLAVLIAAPRRDLRIVGLAAWAVGGLALIPYLAPEGKGALLAAAAAVGLGAAAVGAVALRRWPWALALGALACTPARIPVDVGDVEEANLLVPLYGVVAAAALALGYDLLRGDHRARELGPLAWPLAAVVAWSGLSLLWSGDLREGSIDLLFFFLPFGLLAVCLARLSWSRAGLQLLYAALAAMALGFAAVGIYQWVTRDIFWNPKVDVSNAFAPFYRVNSVFWDPSIYGRFLVIAILATLVIALCITRLEIVLGAAALTAVVWAGLLFSFSQSSFAALIAGVLLAAAFVWRWRSAAAVALAAVAMLTVGFSTPQVRDNLLDQSRRGLDRATSGRWGLIEDGARIALDHPLGGVGLGGFKDAYAERTGLRGEEPARAASHNTPITVAAETGLPGLALLVWLVAAAILTALRLAGRRRLTGRVSLFAALGVTAIAVHSLFYDAFFEDPMTWGLFALAALSAAAVASASAPEDEGLWERLRALRSRERVEVGA
jgi:putative inorganic carbon (HCO3(-)) transporter